MRHSVAELDFRYPSIHSGNAPDDAPNKSTRDVWIEWTDILLVLNSYFGLQGELGELFDLYKKHRYQGHSLNKDALKLELGDLMWYAAEMATALGFSMSEVMVANIEKLKARYPEGFDKARSMNRPAES